MKNKGKIFLTALFIALILFGVGLYLYEVLVKDLSPTENVFKLIILAVSGTVGLIKLYAGGNKRRTLTFYEERYPNELDGAFVDNPTARKALLSAVRLYNENKFTAAIKMLKSLREKCSSRSDSYSVELFIALAHTDMGESRTAMQVYENMLNRGLASSTVYGNLGSLYSSLGMKEEAIEVFKLAIDADPTAHVVYNNLAQLEFKLGELESAKEHAHKAVEISFKSRQAASLLAIIYTVEENEDMAKKYTQIAISAGENSIKLQQAKSYYKNLFVTDDEEELSVEDEE